MTGGRIVPHLVECLKSNPPLYERALSPPVLGKMRFEGFRRKKMESVRSYAMVPKRGTAIWFTSRTILVFICVTLTISDMDQMPKKGCRASRSRYCWCPMRSDKLKGLKVLRTEIWEVTQRNGKQTKRNRPNSVQKSGCLLLVGSWVCRPIINKLVLGTLTTKSQHLLIGSIFSVP